MDEEEEMIDEEQNTAEQINQEIQDTEKLAKDATSLGTNVSTGNAVGAVKDAVKIIFNKQFWKRIIIKAVQPIIITILLAAMLFGIFNAVGDKLTEIVSSIGKLISFDYSDGSIDITDEQVDIIINGIQEMGIDIYGLKLMGEVDYTNPNIQEENQKALRKYIREFYEAQEMTQTLNTNPNWLEELVSGGEPYGTVYVHRATGDTTSATDKNQLTYIEYEKMEKKQQNGDTDILNYFSVDEEGKLVVGGWTTTVVKVDGKKQSEQTIIELQHIDYKTAVSQYTTSMNFLVYLAMISQNPEFVSAVTDLVKQSDIRITLMDKDTISVSTEIQKYVEHTKTVEEVEIEQDEYTREDPETEFEVDYDEKEVTIETEITTTSKKPIVAITYAKTWFSEQTVTYNKVNIGPDTVIGEVMDGEPDEEEPELDEDEEGSVSWITDRTVQVNTTTTITQYEEGTRGNVIDKTGERGSQGIKDLNGNGKVDSNEKVDENSTFIGLLDNKFKIPNTTRYSAAGGNIVSGAEMLFYLLQRDPSAQNLEIWMRYILNKYTGNNRYGDIDFNDIASSYEIRMLSTGSNYIVNTTMSAPSLCITDEKVLREAISKIYSGDVRDNLVKEASNFIRMQEQYHVNAVFAVAVTMVESTAGTNWQAIDSSTYNWYSIRGDGSTTWRKYSSFKEATMDFGNLIANEGPYFKAGKFTVEEIAPVYCDDTWGASVISIMNEIYAAVGIDLPSSGFVTGGITTDEAARELQSYIENNLIHTVVHKTGQYQNGPFAKWWSTGYNYLDKFQCTWWANGRASMYLEQSGSKYNRYPTTRGNGGDYYNINKQNGWFKYGSTPKPNSIISWTNNGYGHVAYVEGVTSDGIYISHAGYGMAWYGIQKIPLDGSFGAGYRLNGYIYLDEPN